MRGAVFLLAGLVGLAGCDAGAGREGGNWEGTVDTLAGGQIVVHNVGAGVWPEGEEWRIAEELRLGSMEEEGPETFGQIRSLAVDPAGRVWVLDGQAKELRVFDPSGAHVRTVGRSGGGPGEFGNPVHVDRSPEGTLWVMDPANARVSVFDTAGTYLDGHTAAGGFIMLPWPGGFDGEGRYHAPVPVPQGDFRIGLARYDAWFTPLDTLTTPTDPIERDYFRIEADGRTRVSAGIPFQGGLQWDLAPDGTFWSLVTDQYRLFRTNEDGDTLQTITRAFDPPPVTPADRQEALDGLEWFTRQGGRVDPSRIPATKPPTQTFFIDDESNLWVAVVTADGEPGRRWEVFGGDGRLLGPVEFPFTLQSSPRPILGDGLLHGIIRDELDVPYVVRARVVRPEPGETWNES